MASPAPTGHQQYKANYIFEIRTRAPKHPFTHGPQPAQLDATDLKVNTNKQEPQTVRFHKHQRAISITEPAPPVGCEPQHHSKHARILSRMGHLPSSLIQTVNVTTKIIKSPTRARPTSWRSSTTSYICDLPTEAGSRQDFMCEAIAPKQIGNACFMAPAFTELCEIDAR